MEEIHKLSRSLRTRLYSPRIRTVGDLLRQKPGDLLRLLWVGPARVRAIEEVLALRGLRLGMSGSEIAALPDTVVATKLCDPSELDPWESE